MINKRKPFIKNAIMILFIAVIMIAVTVFVVIPAVKTSTLKIKYISADQAPWSVGNDWSGDTVGYGGKIIIYLDCSRYLSQTPNGIYGAYNADQYITFSGLSIGKHTIEVDKGTLGDFRGYKLLAGKEITSHAAIQGDTNIDIHYKDGFF